jgi:hypothetical protein
VIENTSNQYGPFDLPILGGSASAIERMEADGQRQLLESCDLPTEGSDDPEFLRLGFTFGEPHKADPLFRPATLPKGWKRAGTDHSMHTNIVDELGRERVGVFYKAAFYDRRADMRLATVSSYVSSLLYYGGTPILDDEVGDGGGGRRGRPPGDRPREEVAGAVAAARSDGARGSRLPRGPDRRVPGGHP